jgi:hypothetical protein
MNRSTASSFLFGVGFGVAVAWLLEALTTGRGAVSTYLAPFAFVAPVVGALLRRGAR